jgi:hypothetical protein
MLGVKVMISDVYDVLLLQINATESFSIRFLKTVTEASKMLP